MIKMVDTKGRTFMAYFPFFMNIEGKRVLIVGGGRSALFKIKKLLSFGANLEVIALESLQEIKELEIKGKLCVKHHSFSEMDLIPIPFFVVIALEDKEENHKIAHLCKEKGILVNVVDDPSYCDFYFPSLVTKGKCSIGISTSGASPAIAGLLREQIEQLVSDQMEEIMDWLEQKRPELKEQFPTEKARKQVIRMLYLACVEKQRILTKEEYELLIASL